MPRILILSALIALLAAACATSQPATEPPAEEIPVAQPETTEPRTLEFELQTPASARGKCELTAHAWYYVCEDRGGTCLFLHQAIPVVVNVVE